MVCTNFRDDMIDVLYGEAGTEAARRLEQHVSTCADCSAERAALKALRADLKTWTLPASLRRTSETHRGRTLAAAAALVLLLLGAALGRGLTSPGASLEARFRAEEARRQAEIDSLRNAVAAASQRDDASLLAHVDERIRASEARQALLLAASLSDLSAHSEAQRRYDLARVSAGLSYLDGRAGQQAARTTELMGYLLQASQDK